MKKIHYLGELVLVLLFNSEGHFRLGLWGKARKVCSVPCFPLRRKYQKLCRAEVPASCRIQPRYIWNAVIFLCTFCKGFNFQNVFLRQNDCHPPVNGNRPLKVSLLTLFFAFFSSLLLMLELNKWFNFCRCHWNQGFSFSADTVFNC